MSTAVSNSQKGPLSPVGDTLGHVLYTTLKPTAGVLTGSVGQPAGEAAARVKQAARHEMGYSDEDNGKPDSELPGGNRIGGNQQSGQNPLGL